MLFLIFIIDYLLKILNYNLNIICLLEIYFIIMIISFGGKKGKKILKS